MHGVGGRFDGWEKDGEQEEEVHVVPDDVARSDDEEMLKVR